MMLVLVKRHDTVCRGRADRPTRAVRRATGLLDSGGFAAAGPAG